MTGLTILIVLLAFLLCIMAFAKTALFKGWFGETMINTFLPMKLGRKGYHFYKNVTLPTSDDRTTQIDHVIVSRYGVFVIETKNLRGWIFGTADDETWTQKFRSGSFTFQNPLRQNYKHIKVLQELLKLPDKVFKNIVFLGPDCRFTRELPAGVLTRGLSRYIGSFTQEVLTQEQLESVIETIDRRRLAPGLSTHLQHVENARQIIAEKDVQRTTARKPVAATSTASSSVPACPVCGAVMVERMAKRGKNAGGRFWGCSTYPVCHGILNKAT